MTAQTTDIAIIGAGAAGLMAAIWAGRTYPHQRVTLLDSAQKLGAKILVAGGGRCNVTHDVVDEKAYAGSSRNAIKKVLRSFDVAHTTDFFREIGVQLKREETGKLFPTTDSARTVLDSLLNAVREAGVDIQHPRRVESIDRDENGFTINGAWGALQAQQVILATGGRSLPKSGSDGHGYELARALGHSITPRIFPALVPLTLPRDYFLCILSGVTVLATLELYSGTGKKLVSFTNSTLCTHFGLSGPSVLDISRYWIDAQRDDPQAVLAINWLPHTTSEQLDQALQQAGHITLLRHFNNDLPERLLRALCEHAEVAPATFADQLSRQQRKAVVQAFTRLPLPISGNRGYTYAEVTAGGVPLSEINLSTMESRVCPGLFLCGEICDVDGRIGGFNFQWAWSSGYMAGVSVGKVKEAP